MNNTSREPRVWPVPAIIILLLVTITVGAYDLGPFYKALRELRHQETTTASRAQDRHADLDAIAKCDAARDAQGKLGPQARQCIIDGLRSSKTWMGVAILGLTAVEFNTSYAQDPIRYEDVGLAFDQAFADLARDTAGVRRLLDAREKSVLARVAARVMPETPIRDRGEHWAYQLRQTELAIGSPATFRHQQERDLQMARAGMKLFL